MEWLLTGGGISKVTKNSYGEQEKQFKFNLVKSLNNYFNICTVFTVLFTPGISVNFGQRRQPRPEIIFNKELYRLKRRHKKQ